MITTHDLAQISRFEELRTRLFALIKLELARDEHHKPYEGAVRIGLPGYFYEGTKDAFSIEVDCYLVGPTRHYQYNGETFKECVDGFEKDLVSWVKEYKESVKEDYS